MRTVNERLATILIVSALGISPAQVAAQRIDLITIGVPDLPAAISVLEALGGVRPALGGTHPTRGTHNALLSLGNGSYLEILAARPAPEATAAAELRALGRPTLLWWGLATDDMEATKEELSNRGFATAADVSGSRRTPEGSILSWRTSTLEQAIDGAPFFIEWSKSSVHPSRTAPSGCILGSLSVVSPAARSLGQLMPNAPTTLRVEAGGKLRTRVEIDCPRGRLVFESA